MRDSMKNRSFGEIFAAVILVILLITDMIYLFTNKGDITFSMKTFFFLLSGCLTGLIIFLLKWPDLSFIPFFFLAAAVGWQCYCSLPTISDIWNHVVYIGGNQTAAVLFLTIFFTGTLIYALSSRFWGKNKSK